MRHLTCKTTQIATKCNQYQNRDPNATIGLLKLISTQKVYITYDKQGSILHYLGTNHLPSEIHLVLNISNSLNLFN